MFPVEEASAARLKFLSIFKELGPCFEIANAFASGGGRTSRCSSVEESSHRFWCRSVMGGYGGKVMKE